MTRPCVRGTRIAVGDILGHLAGGTSEDQILADFPQLIREDIRACLTYAVERERVHRVFRLPEAHVHYHKDGRSGRAAGFRSVS